MSQGRRYSNVQNYTMKKRQTISAFVHHYHTISMGRDLKGLRAISAELVTPSVSWQGIISSQGLEFALSILYL